MKYHEILNDMIKNSQMSLRDISKKCKGLGGDVSPAYLSLLKTGKVPPASADISKIIARVCDRSKMYELVFTGYVEKAPEEIRSYIELLKNTNENLTEYIAEKFSFIEYRKLAKELEEVDRLNFLFDYSTNITKEKNDEYAKKLRKNYSRSNVEEYSKYFMIDDSMEPLIPKNSKLQIIEYKNKDEYKILNRDIVVYSEIGTDAYKIRRIYLKKGKVILVPENKKNDIDIKNSINDIIIIGKVNYYKATVR